MQDADENKRLCSCLCNCLCTSFPPLVKIQLLTLDREKKNFAEEIDNTINDILLNHQTAAQNQNKKLELARADISPLSFDNIFRVEDEDDVTPQQKIRFLCNMQYSSTTEFEKILSWVERSNIQKLQFYSRSSAVLEGEIGFEQEKRLRDLASWRKDIMSRE